MEWLSFLMSMVPFVELRGAIPLAIWYNPGVSPILIFFICVLLNILAIPIAFLLLDFILPPVRRKIGLVERIFKWSVRRAKKHENLGLAGLALFVGVPLPATGAYTGTLIAHIAGVDRKKATIAISGGVVIAGVLIWTLAVFGIFVIPRLSP